MKRFVYILIVSTLVCLVVFLVYLWKEGSFDGCASPVKVTDWKGAMESTWTMPSGLKLREVVKGDHYHLFMGVIPENTVTKSQKNEFGECFFQMLAGEAVLHNGIEEKEGIKWYQDISIQEGQAFLLPKGLIYQFEVKGEHPLVFSLFAPLEASGHGRQFLEDYNPEKSSCL